MPIDDQDVQARAVEALLVSISRSVVGIVGKTNGEFGKGIGTGNLVLVSERPHILTAAHVIRDCTPAELRFFMPGSIEIQERLPGHLPRLHPTEVFPREPLAIKSIREDPKIDIALLELSDVYLTFPTLSFRAITPIPDLLAGAETILMGFPAKRAQRFGVGFAVFRYVEYPQVVDPGTRLYSDFDSQDHLLPDYPASEDYDPGGFSGSALWEQRNPLGVWHPDPQIVGMVAAYHRRVKLLRAVSARRLADFIAA